MITHRNVEPLHQASTVEILQKTIIIIPAVLLLAAAVLGIGALIGLASWDLL
jgi:hypothetical protein